MERPKLADARLSGTELIGVFADHHLPSSGQVD
jgi:hypothetical protein